MVPYVHSIESPYTSSVRFPLHQHVKPTDVTWQQTRSTTICGPIYLNRSGARKSRTSHRENTGFHESPSVGPQFAWFCALSDDVRRYMESHSHMAHYLQLATTSFSVRLSPGPDRMMLLLKSIRNEESTLDIVLVFFALLLKQIMCHKYLIWISWWTICWRKCSIEALIYLKTVMLIYRLKPP